MWLFPCPEPSMHEALDQLFRYVAWHDTRTAVLLFIPNRG